MSHRAAKRSRQRAKQAATGNRQKLYSLCLARCEGDLIMAADLFQKMSAQFPAMSPAVQRDLLLKMEASLKVLAPQNAAQVAAPQPAYTGDTPDLAQT